MGGKRTQYEIYWEILTYCRNPRSFTGIVHRCNLNSKIGQEHVAFLESKGFLRRLDEGGQSLLKTTDAAKAYLSAFKEMYLELYSRGPEFKL
jgi:predicted transcriptional regulator